MQLPISASLRTQKLTRAALLAALGLVMFLFENILPRPLPWTKPGLANIATILALYSLGTKSALAVTLIRIFVGSFIIGTFFSPGFWLSLGGGLASATAMILVYRYGRRGFSILGASLVGALAHVLAQISLAGLLIVHRVEILYLLPLMLWPALFAGLIVGIAALLLLNRLMLSSSISNAPHLGDDT